jgi:hypothetical protein
MAQLKGDAQKVLDAIKHLRQSIHSGIQNNDLKDGSYIDATVLNGLSLSQRLRVLQNIVGPYYEHKKTHNQYKVVLDESENKLVLISAQMSPEHVCVHYPE